MLRRQYIGRLVLGVILVLAVPAASIAQDQIAAKATPKRVAKRMQAPGGAFDGTIDLDALRAAIRDLAGTFGPRYPGATKYLARLEQIENRLAAANSDVPKIQADLVQLQREALLANPLVSGQPILFMSRPQYRADHHNTETMFQTGEINTGSFQGGGAIKTIDLARGGEVKTLLACPQGIVRDPEVHWEGGKIVFSMRKNIQGDYHVYEINADGGGLRQLTCAPGVTDIDPLYLPDDRIAFTSTREPKYCMCNRHIMGNLFEMEADGANIRQIGKSTLHEGHGSIMSDGRIMYDRWEYVDRNFGDAQGLWSVNPDGTNHAIVWGNNTPSPGAVLDARVIPVTGQIVCTFGSCHDRPWGAMAIIDPRLGLDGRTPVIRTWPARAIDLVRDPGTAETAYDSTTGVRPKYEDPYPLSDKYFLVSRMTGKGEQMGIYLVDVFGNEMQVHAEEPGCFDPMPLSPRPRPPVIPTRRDYENKDGYFYVHNVYQGTHMQGVQRGSVKYLRVVESPEKRFWTNPAWSGGGTIAPAMNWHDFNNKEILGTVPVEEDGSAYFAVPSDRFVYFQLLDDKGMMIQSMRSGVIVQSGEKAGCVGCHEERRSSPPPDKDLRALRRPASPITGWYGPPRLFNYLAEVQPVFDRNCAKCHDYGKEGTKKLLLARDKGLCFNASYFDLWSKGKIHVVGAGPCEIQPAYSWGSHASKLVAVLLKGHHKVKLSAEDFDRIVTWVDINAPYYPTYASAYPGNLYGRSPLDGGQLGRLGKLLGLDLNHQGNAAQISFDRPEKSPGLARIADRSDPKYIEALAIIQAGKEMLAKRPDGDMSGFVACEIDRKREQKYDLRHQIELRNREAIRRGEKLYDAQVSPPIGTPVTTTVTRNP